MSSTPMMWIMGLSGVMMTMMLRNDVGEHKLYFFSDTNYISIDKYNLIFFILILRMSWLLGGVAYDVAKWTVKKGIEGIKEAHRISQNAEANRIRYQNDPEFRK